MRRQRPSALTPDEERVLAILRECTPTRQELAEHLGRSVQAASALLYRLARKVPIVALFKYGETRYRLMEDHRE